MKSEQLYVVTAISNPCRYESRYRLYRQFAEHVKDSGAHLLTVEGVFGERAPVIADAVHIRIQDELWHKENLLNIGISRLPECARYIAWIDADIRFLQPNWASETVQALQHYDIVQPFSTALDLGPEKLGSQAVQLHKGFCYQYLTGAPIPRGPGYEFWHPGFAWAARREALDKLEGLIDWTLLGAGDHIMALALVGRVKDAIAGGLSPEYYALAQRWQYLAEKQIKRNIGYVPGLIHHHWHGKKENRKYVERWEILRRNQYNPKADIMRDTRGAIRLADNKPQLRDDLRAYFRQRLEDSQDI
jgi:hypothetical protein